MLSFYRYYIYTALAGLLLGAAGAWWLAPRRVEVRTQVKTETKTVTVTQYKDRWRTRVVVIKKPDGTVIESHTDSGEHTQTAERERDKTAERTAVQVSEPPRWSVSALGGLGPSWKPAYGGHVQYRLIGPLQVGAWGLAGSTIAGGVSLGLVF